MTRAIALMARCPALAAREAAVHCGQGRSRCLREKITRPHHRHPASRRASTHSRGAAVTTAVMDPNAFPSQPGGTTAQPRGAPPGVGPQKRVRDSLGVAGNNDRTWQDRLGGLKARGPGMGKNGPRRVIKRTVTKPSEAAVPKPKPTVAGEREWARVETMRAQQAAAEARRRGANGRDVSSSTNDTNAPWQKEETVSYSFFGQSRVRYPAASLADPAASRAVYEDSELDKTAIQVNALLLAEAAGVDPNVLNGGDVRSFAALAEAAHHLRRQHSPEDLRRIVGKIMRSQITGGIPPGGTGVAQFLLPGAVLRETTGTIASEMAEWMFGPTTRETMAGPNGRDVTVVNVKKCRYLEATGCAGVCVNMCKLPAQDVMREEFGVGLYVAPNFETCSCKMYFGQEPLPEQIDPALSRGCLSRCGVAAMNTPPPPPPPPALPIGADGWPAAVAWTEDSVAKFYESLPPPRLEKCPELPKKARVI